MFIWLCVEFLMVNMTETVKLTIEIPKKVWDCLTWYMRNTVHWCGDEMEERAAAGYVIQMIKDYLEMEANNPHDALDYIKHTMQADHLPNL